RGAGRVLLQRRDRPRAGDDIPPRVHERVRDLPSAHQPLTVQEQASFEASRGTESMWGPLRQPLYRSLWIASFASNLGTLMQSVGASWMMTSLTPSPTVIALVQTATNLPIFLLALPAGALADVVDRRRVLLFTQTWMLVAAALLGVLTL